MNPLFKLDSYKLFHRQMYPDNTTMVYSNWTPRSNRHYSGNNTDGVVVFGIQAVLKKLIKDFEDEFFSKDKATVCAEYKSTIEEFVGAEYSIEHIEYLHDIGHLPLVIKALPEGTMCPIGVPALTMYNTDPKCFWLTNYLETLFSAELWPHMTNATIAREYRQILQQYGELTGVPDDFIQWQGHDFSKRGLYGGAAAEFGMAHLTSFTGTDTIPAFMAVKDYYPTEKFIASSVPASEHSVQCSHYTGDGDEEEYMRHMLDTFPTGIVSIVCDGFDYWNFLTVVLPKFKDEIMAREGRVVLRPDSGNIVDIICGDESKDPDNYTVKGWKGLKNNHVYKGSIEVLWDIFGGTKVQGKDGKMYKHLDPHIGLIYGDSVTIPIAIEICERLVAKGFSTNNLVLGIGSFTYQFNTRDTFGFAMKATYIEQTYKSQTTVDGTGGAEVSHREQIIGKEIFKDPKTKGNMSKKSLKGLIKVSKHYNEETHEPSYYAVDQVSWEEEQQGELREIFRDGEMLIDESFDTIRERVKASL